jgi:hypothetical protein
MRDRRLPVLKIVVHEALKRTIFVGQDSFVLGQHYEVAVMTPNNLMVLVELKRPLFIILLEVP